MIFQTLDNKKECVAVYVDGEILNELPEGLTKTWSYSAFLEDLDVEYASLYCEGKTLSEFVPEHLKKDWDRISGKMRSFAKAFKAAKIDLKQICFFDMVPKDVLLEWCDIKTSICHIAFEENEKPANYDFLVGLTKLVERIKLQPINFDLGAINKGLESYKSREFIKRINKCSNTVQYDIFGTVTGRLSAKPGSFPIMTMDRKYRKIVKPNNDWFLELDFNGAEFRTFLALSGESQPEGDVHSWNMSNLFEGDITRDEAKVRLFAWLYNPKAKDKDLDNVYSRKELLKVHYDGVYVNTPYGREIRAIPKNALNYLIQSTQSDIFLSQVIKIDRLLKNKKSYIAWTMHDSVVIDLKQDEKAILKELIECFGKTDYGNFRVNVSAGNNFGELKKIR